MEMQNAIYGTAFHWELLRHNWLLCKITLQDGYFVHENQGSFFDPLGGEKYFTLAMGEEWTGEDPMDDFM